MTNTWPVLDEAHRALRTVIAALKPEDWTRPTPCTQWNVAQVLQHAAGDQLGYAAALTGTGGPTFDPFSPSGHLPETDMAAFAEQTLQTAAAAWSTVPADAVEVPTPLPQGNLPGWLAASACALDAAVHAWDIAKATAQPSLLTNDLAADLLKAAQELVEPLRSWGAYAAVIPSTPADDTTATLLRYLGRDPHWTPAA
ncbi:TIGR03086 family protein [Dactylosporangium vinaceum]|uniref:TIGR03086 family metal-binding protein n=1 Tax=Dactylosporangium vinaceum TaxID=53362 RepID=A0ABV5LY84_9ACTN|nr:TIGR03086 family metal-binding protein [Dactylosporangium vinaceum]UAB95828.1 TIGR03086 family protein [Dactylosporangium vinaceum]